MTVTMSQPDPPKLYLAAPATGLTRDVATQLDALLKAIPAACLRLPSDTVDEDDLVHMADRLRDIAHAYDVPVVIDDRADLAARLGLDGVHLTDGHRAVAETRSALGAEAIVGAYCGASRHNGMIAGERGADYVSFGPVVSDPTGSAEDAATPELFAWWAEMIEVPVVAEGDLTPAALAALAGKPDFYCLGSEIWDDPDGPLAAAHRLAGLF